MADEAPPSVRPEGFDDRTIYDWFHNGPGAGPTTDRVADEWRGVGSDYGEVHDLISQSMMVAQASWEGSAAEAMNTHMFAFTNYVNTAHDAAMGTMSQIAEQSGAVRKAQNSVAPPVSVPDKPWYNGFVPWNTGYDDAVGAKKESDAHNQHVLATYGASTQGNVGTLPQFGDPASVGSDLVTPAPVEPRVGGGHQPPGGIGGVGNQSGGGHQPPGGIGGVGNQSGGGHQPRGDLGGGGGNPPPSGIGGGRKQPGGSGGGNAPPGDGGPGGAGGRFPGVIQGPGGTSAQGFGGVPGGGDFGPIGSQPGTGGGGAGSAGGGPWDSPVIGGGIGGGGNIGSGRGAGGDWGSSSRGGIGGGGSGESSLGPGARAGAADPGAGGPRPMAGPGSDPAVSGRPGGVGSLPGMAGGGAGRRSEDTEHRSPKFLIDTHESFWTAGLGKTVPPVIGLDPPPE